MADINQRAIFGVDEAAIYLNLGENEIRRMVHTGELTGFTTRGGGRWLISRAACDRWIEIQEQTSHFVPIARSS